MNLSHATFTAFQGCLIEIDGWKADIESKPAMMMQGACFVRPLDLKDTDKAEAISTVACGEHSNVWGCGDARLAELAARFRDWLGDEANAPWAETVVEPLPDGDAKIALMRRLAEWT